MDEKEYRRTIYLVQQRLAECETKIMQTIAAIEGIVDGADNVHENKAENKNDGQKVLRFDGYRRVK